MLFFFCFIRHPFCAFKSICGAVGINFFFLPVSFLFFYFLSTLCNIFPIFYSGNYLVFSTFGINNILLSRGMWIPFKILVYVPVIAFLHVFFLINRICFFWCFI